MANETVAGVVNFPFRPGNPHDPNLAVVSNALRTSQPEASDADCRTMTRELALVFERRERETRGMTAQQKSEYNIIQLRELLIEIYVESGLSESNAEDKAFDRIVWIAGRIGEHRAEKKFTVE
jgi:hypothetical protein